MSANQSSQVNMKTSIFIFSFSLSQSLTLSPSISHTHSYCILSEFIEIVAWLNCLSERDKSLRRTPVCGNNMFNFTVTSNFKCPSRQQNFNERFMSEIYLHCVDWYFLNIAQSIQSKLDLDFPVCLLTSQTLYCM